MKTSVYAISVKQPWANMIASGEKTIETRKWHTDLRGDLLIVSSKVPRIEPAGKGLALAKLVDCRPMQPRDVKAAKCEYQTGAFSWVLSRVMRIKPIDVQGHLGLYVVELDLDGLEFV